MAFSEAPLIPQGISSVNTYQQHPFLDTHNYGPLPPNQPPVMLAPPPVMNYHAPEFYFPRLTVAPVQSNIQVAEFSAAPPPLASSHHDHSVDFTSALPFSTFHDTPVSQMSSSLTSYDAPGASNQRKRQWDTPPQNVYEYGPSETGNNIAYRNEPLQFESKKQRYAAEYGEDEQIADTNKIPHLQNHIAPEGCAGRKRDLVVSKENILPPNISKNGIVLPRQLKHDDRHQILQILNASTFEDLRKKKAFCYNYLHEFVSTSVFQKTAGKLVYISF